MLLKFEKKSNRVKGVAFHPKRTWILTSLHSGVIQLWDYRMGILVDRFEEHDGPVRGVDFHSTQPLFVSGGDDYKIKVWNYKQKRCLFTLLGHLDYIRTVQFHHESPWIVSASDDQTIRIWNWQSRSCIQILTGHNHYVMCAQFHPKEDLIVSGISDQTIRVWDMSGLRKKTSASGGAASIGVYGGMGSFMGSMGSFTTSSGSISGSGPLSLLGPNAYEEGTTRNPFMQSDIFGNMDVIVKYVLEGHDRGVNWAAFHPTLPFIVSGGDDRLIKIWRMSEIKAWEVDTLRGHHSNVSCVLFHPRQDLIISNSEDKSIRVWDMGRRVGVQTFRREHDRFWVIAAHPEFNLFAAGHDSGFIVFKLERERPAHVVHQNYLFYIKDAKKLRMFDFDTGKDVLVAQLKRPSGSGLHPIYISYNPAEHALLVYSYLENGTYEFYRLPRESIEGGGNEVGFEPKRGSALGSVFVARNRFAILEKPQTLAIRNLQDEPVKTIKMPVILDGLFYAGTGHLLLRHEAGLIMYDIQQQKMIAELACPRVNHVSWSPDMSTVALMGKQSLVLATRKLEQLCTIQESLRIKYGAWDESGVFIYATLSHLKYCLPQGDNGIIRTIDQPLYPTKIVGQSLFCLDRQEKIRVINIDPAEFRFKLALIGRRYDEVLHLIKTSNLMGQAIIAYLQKMGYPEIAMHFVRDEKTRFMLSLECGNLEVALDTAKTMDKPEYWESLVVEALRQGNQQIVEFAYQRTKAFDKLSFLYLVTGNNEKLMKMMKIAEFRGDMMARFHNALYLNNVEERLRILREAGLHQLAYLLAKSHGLQDVAADILDSAGISAESLRERVKEQYFERCCPMIPCKPVRGSFDKNWPVRPVSKGILNTLFAPEPLPSDAKVPTYLQPSPRDISSAEKSLPRVPEKIDLRFGELEKPSISGEEEDREYEAELHVKRVRDMLHEMPAASSSEIQGTISGGGWDIEEFNVETEAGFDNQQRRTDTGEEHEYFVPPSFGTAFYELWTRNSSLAIDHIAAGAFDSAMGLLNSQFGIVNFKPLKSWFLKLYLSSRAHIYFLPNMPPLIYPFHRKPQEPTPSAKGVPTSLRPAVVTFNQSILMQDFQRASQATTSGRFSEALEIFRQSLQRTPLVFIKTKEDLDKLRNFVSSCREYIIGLSMELVRKELPKDDPQAIVRGVELATYFTHCQIELVHRILSLRSAMSLTYKIRNFLLASVFARHLIELEQSPTEATTQARKLLQICAKTPTDEVNLDFDDQRPFRICAASYTPIYEDQPTISCPLCGANFKYNYRNTLCTVCQLARVDAPASGFRILEKA